MKKIRHLLIIIMVMLLLPLNVNAAKQSISATYNSTGLSTYGSIVNIIGSNGNDDNDTGSGIILFEDVSNTSNLVTVDVVATADSSREIVSLKYELFEGMKSLFQDTITGEDIVNNNGGTVRVKFSFTNKKVSQIKVSAVTRKRSGNKNETTTNVYSHPIEFYDILYTDGSCKGKLKISLSSTGKTNTSSKKAEKQIKFENVYESKTKVDFDLSLEAYSYHKIENVMYELYNASGKLICKDTIRGAKLRKNEGSALLKFSILDTKASKIKITTTAVKREEPQSGNYVKSNELSFSFNEDFNIGDCLKENGSASFVEAGTNNSAGGNINYKKDTNNFSEFIVQADSGAKVEKIPYFLYDSNGGEICSGEITGSKIKHPSVRIKMSFKNSKVRKIKICMYSDQKNKHCETNGLDMITNSNDGGGAGITVNDNLVGGSLGDLTPEEYASNICDEGEESLSDFIIKYWGYVMICAPILLMVMMIVDFLKALTSNDAEHLKKCGSNSIKRVIATVLLLMLPLIVTAVFSLMGLENYLCF